MTAIPAAAIAVIAAAYEDYRLTTPAHQQTPHGAAQQAAQYLTSSGWGLHVPHTQPRPRTRAKCPACTVRHLVTQAGLIRRHGPHGHPCTGSGTPARPTAHTERPAAA